VKLDKAKVRCINDGPTFPCYEVRWVRCTQFAGDHPYCGDCAPKEKDFGDDTNSHSYWCTIEEY
jgi:hypothetical protein